MHIEQSGDNGPALILFHGWAMHSGIFAPLLPLLKQQFRVYCVDLPGHGQSLHAPQALAFDAVWRELSARITEPAYMMGWSLGGLFALYGALQFPSQCRGLIMHNASPCFVHRAHWPLGMPAQVFNQFASELQHNYALTLQRFFMLEAQGSEHMRHELRCLQNTAFQYGKPSATVLEHGLNLLQHSDFHTDIASLQVPSLWLAGRRDKLVKPEAMQFASQLCGGHYEVFEHSGHAPFLTHPERVQHALNRFCHVHEHA